MTLIRMDQGPGSGPAGLDMTTGLWDVDPSRLPQNIEVPGVPGAFLGADPVYLAGIPGAYMWDTDPGGAIGLQEIEPEVYAALEAGPAGSSYEHIGAPPGEPTTILKADILGGILGGIAGWFTGGAAEATLGAITGFFDDGGQGGTEDMANGVDLYGHEGMVQNGGMVPVGGPGVPEPPAAMVAKYWKTKAFSKTHGEYWVHFWKLIDGRMMCYNATKREWKMWRPKKPIVLYRGKVTLSQAVRAQRMLDKLWKTVAKRTKALKLA